MGHDHISSIGGHAVGDGLHPPVREEDRVLASDLGNRGLVRSIVS